MASNIVISKQARKDLQEIYDWYEDQQPGFGEMFLDAVDKCVERIAITPTSASVRYDNMRCKLVKRFPYLIHYSFKRTDQIVNIYRIFHASRRPLWER